MRHDRGRLTPVDLVFFLASFAVLAALGPIFFEFLNTNAYQLTTPQVWLARLLIPFVLLTILALIYTNAVAGFNR